MKSVLSIAGTEPTGGAGIQADLKTVEAHNLYGMSVITAVVAQNTLGVTAVQPVSPTLVGQQIDCVFDDIRPDATIIGMLHNSEIIRTVAARLRAHHADNIVLDPVMISSSGHDLLRPDAAKALVEELFPLCTLVTPNLAVAAALSGLHIANKAQIDQAAPQTAPITQGAALFQGGKRPPGTGHTLDADVPVHGLAAPLHNNPNTHGTGCTLSSAIACGLAQGFSLTDSVKRAKRYLTACIQFGLDLGHGSGPLQHKVDWE